MKYIFCMEKSLYTLKELTASSLAFHLFLEEEEEA